MSAHAPRLPWSLDPLIAEAKRRARRRRWLILSVLVVAVAAVAATLALRSASGSGLATGGPGPVIHIVLESPPSTAYFNLETGHETRATSGEEMWLDQPKSLHRIVSTEGGRRVADEVWRSHYGPTTQAATVTRFFARLVIDYRLALMSGRARLVGRGTFDGHHVDWVRMRPQRDRRWWHVLREIGDVGVDARTFKPILLRAHSGKRYVYTRILLAEAIAYHPADFKSHGPRQVPPSPYKQPAPGYAFGSIDPSAPHGTAVHAPWLTAGPTIAGLELRSVTPVHHSQDQASVLLRGAEAQADPRARTRLRAGLGAPASPPGPGQRLREAEGSALGDAFDRRLRGAPGQHVPLARRPGRLDRGSVRLHDRRPPCRPDALDRLPEDTRPLHHDQHAARNARCSRDRPQPPHWQEVAPGATPACPLTGSSGQELAGAPISGSRST